MKIFNLLDSCSLIIDYDVVDYRRWYTGYFLKIESNLADDSILFIREYVDMDERNYSYHWQNGNGDLIIRWDNAPYHPEVISYPHHKHMKDGVLKSKEVAIEDVLAYILKHSESERY